MLFRSPDLVQLDQYDTAYLNELLPDWKRDETRAKVINGVIDEIEILPDHKDRLSAIAELNKMEGDYAPAKSIVTVTKVGLDAIEESYE